MIIEATVIGYLSRELSVPVYGEVPPDPPERFVTVEKVGGARENYVWSATLAIQSWDRGSLLGAVTLSDQAKAAMFDMVGALGTIGGARLDSEYNWTNPETKYYRYQATFQVVHY